MRRCVKMILELVIENFGLISKSHISFKDGLNAITGESGSGKSLILKSIQLLFQDRVSKESVGDFKDHLYIKSVFEPNSYLLEFLSAQGIELSDDDFLIIEKTIYKSKSKRTVIRLNHQMISNDLLKEISPYLLSFSLQNETSMFQDLSYILNILDASHSDLVTDYQEVYKEYQGLSNEISSLKKDKKDNEEKLSYYEFQLKEIDEFNIQKEDFELENVIKRIKNQTKISNVSADIKEKLDEAFTLLEETYSDMQTLESFDDTYKNSEEFADFFYQIENYQLTIQRYISNMYIDDSLNINDLQSRAFKLKDIQRKYGESLEEILETRNELFNKVNTITNFDEVLSKTEKKLALLKKEKLLPLANELHSKRKKYADYLTKLVTEHLSDMGMENTKVLFIITKSEKIMKYGMDEVEVLIQHLEQEPKPISKIASGGELSRIILALKIVTAEKDHTSVILFDEIDAGTGGKTANSIGRKLKLLSKEKQIVCITHTPQVACYSDNHIFVSKFVENKNYISKSAILTEDEVLNEIARMISGSEINNITLENAKQLRKMTYEI